VSSHDPERIHEHEKPRAPERRPDVAEDPAAPLKEFVSGVGNRAFGSAIARTPGAGILPTGEVHPEVQSTINATRGAGASLDGGVADRLSPSLGDLSDVRVHTGDTADALNTAVAARAFATGSDVYFAQGEYKPNTADGDRLIAHELAHVVQQQRLGPAIQRQPVGDPLIPPELLTRPDFALLNDDDLVARHDRMLDLLARFTRSTRQTAQLEDQAARIGVELGRRKALRAGRTFTDDAIKKLREYFVENAKSEKDSCIIALNKGMKVVTAKPALPTTPESIEKTMAKVAAAGSSSEAREVWFRSKSGKISKGGARPERLDRSIWDTVLALAGGDPGWSVFTMSLLDGFHSVTLTLDANDPNAPRIYWSDQWKSRGGWQLHTRASLDAEVTRLVQSWWDGQAEGKKFPPVVRLWRVRSQ
jgi:uncharacterized protein DUF4157